MEITKTIKLKITSHTEIFQETLDIYRQALAFIVNVVNQEWDNISVIEKQTSKVNFIEQFIHGTRHNPFPAYNFDELFYKFPSYLRRSAIAKAIGIVDSYQSNYQNWLDRKIRFQQKGKKFNNKSPTLQLNHYSFPVFYKTNMFKYLSDNQAMIKIYYQNKWQWIIIDYKADNLKNRDLDKYKEHNPSLVKSGKKYYLHVPYTKQQKLNTTKLDEKIIVSVDLGLTNSAVCSAMRIDGTVIGRCFINQPVEKDRLYTKLNQLAKANSLSGAGRKPNYWRRINGLSKQIVQDTVNQIIKFAEIYNAAVIVFEHLGKLKISKDTSYPKRLKLKLQFWCKQKIQKKAKEKAHSKGIRFSRVTPKNTSKLAYDGTGEVTRSIRGDLCTFTTGKQYHSDLSASYNIGSRYFIREILKTLPEKVRLSLEAKVPSVANRTCCTLASLISLNKAMATM